jgi:hypothetical protein
MCNKINEISSNLQTTSVKILEVIPANLCLVASFFSANPRQPASLCRSSEGSFGECHFVSQKAIQTRGRDMGSLFQPSSFC